VGFAAEKLLGKAFPWGILAVNVAGCFVMGMVMKVLLDLESPTHEAIAPSLRLQAALWRQGVAIGFLGGLTTFSSFGADTLRAFHAGQTMLGLANVGANVGLSLVAVWCGMAVMRELE
jgi:CrcB protein